MVIGEGPNGLEIPLVPFNSREDAEEFVKQFPTEGDGYLSDAFSEGDAPYTDEDYEHTELGASLYGALFKDGSYYSGCGGCYRLQIVEAQFGQPMVGWDLD